MLASLKRRSSSISSNDNQKAIDFSFTVVDHRVRRRLIFQAEYNVTCSAVNDPVAQSLVQFTAKNHYNQIKKTCQQGELTRG